MQAPSEKNIIPIFSKRKRPRQALYAFPAQGSQNTGSIPSSAPYSQQTFSGSNQYTGHGKTDGWHGTNTASHQPSVESRTGVWQGANRPNNQRNNTSSNKPRATFPYQPPDQPTPNQGPQQPACDMKRPLRPWQQKYDETSPVKTWRPSASPSPHASNYQYVHRNNIQEPQGPRFPSVHPPVMHQSTMHSSDMNAPTMQPSAVHPLTNHQPTMHHAAVSSPRQQPDLPYTPTIHQARGSIGNAPSPFRMPSTPQIPLRHAQPGTAAWEMRNPESAGCTVDKSMKMLTVSIEELRYWTVSRDIQGLLFFELFGILNSAVCSSETGVAKKFTLKDGNHTLQSIFYETDRLLGPLTRGQCLRCVGNILPKEGVFRCVSVRPATLAEQKVMRSMVAACDRGVRERLTATGIEP